MPSDALVVTLDSYRPSGWGWTVDLPGFGLLANQFQQPALHIWSFDTDTLMTDNFREFWPGASEAIYGNGWRRSCGNGDAQNRSTAAGGRQMDIRELAAGSVLYLPVEVHGALFSLGDAHAAQGDGMVGARNAVCEMIDLLTARHSLSPE